MRSASWLLVSVSLLRTQTADMYRLDTVNTRISFNIQHFGVLWVSARFPDFSGAFVLDRRGSASRVDVSVQMASVQCNDSRWNGRLRSADWLDVQRYPQMSFHSSHVDFDGDGRALASGALTLHGVTRGVGLEISGVTCSEASAPGESCKLRCPRPHQALRLWHCSWILDRRRPGGYRHQWRRHTRRCAASPSGRCRDSSSNRSAAIAE
jgi:polyisoprenoid-binding protein YceI